MSDTETPATPPPSPEAETPKPKAPMSEHTKRARSQAQIDHWKRVQEIRRASLEVTKAAREQAYKEQRIERAKKRMESWQERLKKDMEESSESEAESEGSSQDIGGASVTIDDLVNQIVTGLKKTHISAPPPQQQVTRASPIQLNYV